MNHLSPVDSLPQRNKYRRQGSARSSIVRQIRAWRVRRSLRHTRYRIDQRPYSGVFGPGFMSTLRGARLWGGASTRARRDAFMHGLLPLLLAVGALFAGWLVASSIRGLALFR